MLISIKYKYTDRKFTLGHARVSDETVYIKGIAIPSLWGYMNIYSLSQTHIDVNDSQRLVH